MACCQRRSAERHEDGFTLIEVVVSLLLLSIVSAASLGLFIKSMGAGDLQAQRQKAVELANQQIEQVRSLPVGSLEQGRTKAVVDALWAAPPAGIDISQSEELWDPDATATSTAVVPTVQIQTLDNLNYTVSTFVDRCYLASTGTACGPLAVVGYTPMKRVTVGVTWDAGADRRCGTATGICGYSTTTLIDPSSNPVFINS